MSAKPIFRGFTLIELLVVISIIALLMAILLPTLTKARESGRDIQCLSNERQVGIAIEAYTIDSKGQYPVGYLETINSYDQYAWIGKTGTDVVLAGSPAEDRDLNLYMGNPKGFDVEVEIANCPSDDNFYDHYGASYRGNLTNPVPLKTIRNNFATPEAINQSVVKDTSRFVVYSERGAEYFAFQGFVVDSGPINISLAPFSEADLFWHSNEKKFNLLFADGHAAKTEIVDSVLETDDYNWEYE